MSASPATVRIVADLERFRANMLEASAATLIPWALDKVWWAYATHTMGLEPTLSAPRAGITRWRAIELEQAHAHAAVYA